MCRALHRGFVRSRRIGKKRVRRFGLLAGTLARRIANYAQVLLQRRWHADLLAELLVWNPLELGGCDHKGLRIGLGVVNRDGHFQGVMIQARVALLHPHLGAVWMSRGIQPTPVVTPDRI